MLFRGAVDASVTSQDRAGVAGAVATTFPGGALFQSPREAFDRPLPDLDCAHRLDSKCVSAAWGRSARDANLDSRKDASGNP